ncbi:MAG: hypothetical protein F6K28_25190 [Microcoleus sp. SIO2G3]|nr:hypothetical protein [Microcoleus sp. SIO2G3]
MCSYLRLTSIATLLIGLQLFTPKLIDAPGKLSPLTLSSSNSSVIASSGSTSQGLQLANLTSFSKEFDPPDNGGPDNTRGSGTR